MKKLVTLLAGAALMIGIAAGSALAVPYSPSQSELLTYSMLWADNTAVTADDPYDNGTGGAAFNATLKPYTNHFGYVFFGKTYSTGLDLSAYDSFKLHIDNTNENPWNFELGLFNGFYPTPTARANSDLKKINNGSGADLTVDFASFAGVDFSNVNTIGIWVFENVPLIGEDGKLDYHPEFSAAPVPEPGTMVLLGFGLFGLAVYGKRRMNNQA